jgi:hypothetical protein
MADSMFDRIQIVFLDPLLTSIVEARLSQPESLRGLRLSEGSMMIVKTCVLSLSFALFIGMTAAQTPSEPIVKGRHLQPTQQQIDSRESNARRQWDSHVQWEIDHLYDDIMSSAGRPARHPVRRP